MTNLHAHSSGCIFKYEMSSLWTWLEEIVPSEAFITNLFGFWVFQENEIKLGDILHGLILQVRRPSEDTAFSSFAINKHLIDSPQSLR